MDNEETSERPSVTAAQCLSLDEEHVLSMIKVSWSYAVTAGTSFSATRNLLELFLSKGSGHKDLERLELKITKNTINMHLGNNCSGKPTHIDNGFCRKLHFPN